MHGTAACGVGGQAEDERGAWSGFSWIAEPRPWIYEYARVRMFRFGHLGHLGHERQSELVH